ncbi:hypothetical protein L596_007162 [Steinernema carpocapsae]|uniref:VWFD domain-containing protein n=1 Tax=Steinernema carpocapsae TaxID=34508 RepID=A0A4V6A5W2_STECR|nr:hypothetical protein L596_007162 [Steinernema carpocapsae]
MSLPKGFHEAFAILLFFLLLRPLSGSGNFQQLFGKEQICKNEGEKIELPTAVFATINPACLDCSCRKGKVECEKKTCDSLLTCPLAEPPKPGECCSKCLTCNYLGIERQNDERWFSSQNACTIMTCKAGIITISRMQCAEECNHGVRVQGICCKLCSTHRKIPFEKKTRDPCVVCDQRRDRWAHCYRIGCPVLDCPAALRRHIEGRCCPECSRGKDEQPRYATPIGPASDGTRHQLVTKPRYRGVVGGYCTFRNRRFPVFSKFRVDSCTRCKCEEGGIICERFTCPVLNCDPSRIFYREHVCCPFCHHNLPQPCIEVVRGARNVTISRRHKSIWQRDECTQCSCHNGTINCQKITCAEDQHLRCPRGHKKVRPRGRCCSVCEMHEATCTVFGDPHYRTFDGSSFSYQGLCSYILVQDCTLRGQTPQFTVISHNANDENENVVMKRVSILIGNEDDSVFRIQLCKDKLIREQGEMVSVPHERSFRPPQYHAVFDRTGNLVVTFINLGFSLLWDGQAMVEITASRSHRSRLCGLCGNFNNYTADDMLPRYGGAATTDVALFVESWKWGDRCDSKWKKKKIFRCENPAVKKEDLSACKMLRSSMLFVGCRSIIRVHDYIMKCMEDVCENSCDYRNPCFCKALNDYALLCNDSDLLNLPLDFNVQDLTIHPKCPRIRLITP